ncbi:MAG: GNAT family N-acetyltransferase [Bacilli bacterium]|jgi:ribosomal protein S18 acetylase RimI-like enzyme
MNLNIKKIEMYKDFKKVVQVFKDPPFSEILTEKEMIEEFKSYLDNGISYGYYNNNSILGFIGVLKGVQKGHPINKYNAEQVLYINGIAVLKEFRKKGIATKLMNYTIKEIDLYKYLAIYLRTNYQGSKIKNVALKAGFEIVKKEGKIITEDVIFKRNNGEIATDKRMFMLKKL